MKKIFILFLFVTISVITWADEERQNMPPVSFDVKIMPTPQEINNILGVHDLYVQGQDALNNTEMLVTETSEDTIALSLYNYNDFGIAKSDEDTSLYHLGNTKLIEAIIANGSYITGYLHLLDEDGPFRTVRLTINGFDHNKQVFHVTFENNETGTIDYKYMQKHLAYGVCGAEKSATWSIEFIKEKTAEDNVAKMYARSEAVILKAQTLEEAIHNAYNTLKTKYPSFSSEQGKLSCLAHIAPEKSILQNQPQFVNINYELYMYKFKGGVYGKGQVFVYPTTINTKYNMLQFITLNIDRGRCTNYIGGQTDQCEGWGSFYVDHVIIATQFNNGQIFMKIVGYRNCNVAKYSFENYKVPAIVRGTTQWMY